MEKQFLRLREIAIEFPDGTVFGIARLEPVQRGWVVRLSGATDFEGTEGMIKAINIASKTTQYVAGMKDGDVELWDVVEIFKSVNDAIRFGKKNGQMSIFQIETGNLRWLS